jgi:Xaa-Pro aminopeptidase
VIRRLTLILATLAWAPLLRAQVPEAEYAQRRNALAARMTDGVLLALGAREPAQDHLTFYQSPSFYYLTGFTEPDAALLMVKQGTTVTPIMFVQPRLPAREVWTGHRSGPEGVTQRTGMAARSIDALRPTLDSLLAATPHLYVVADLGSGRGPILTPDAQFVKALEQRHANLSVTDLGAAVEQLRSRKSAAELALIQKAVDVTVLAHKEAMRAIQPGMNEFEVQALIEYTFRRNGADRPSFATIVGSGPNSTTLHYNADDRFMNAGEVVVMDIGASYRGYAADVTRTVPVSGKYSPEQRAIYQVVRDAQAAAERQAKLGAPARRMSDSASATLARGLAKLGLIESPDATYDCGRGAGCRQLGLYYMHGLGHGIGLEVHDPDQYYFDQRTIQPGSAFTIEPGIYVRASVLDVLPDTPRNRELIAKLRPAVEKYKNIGVRIEDDYIATDAGVTWISRAPREMDEIEALMRQRAAAPAKRDTAVVNWYRATEPKN